MGWLGWTAPQSLETDVNCIMIAMEGKLEMLYPEIKKAKKARQSTSSRFKTFVKGHNARIKDGR